MILGSKDTYEISVSTGDMREVYTESGIDKPEKWSLPKIVLSVDAAVCTVLILAKGNKRVTVEFQEICIALAYDSLASAVQTAMDEMDR